MPIEFKPDFQEAAQRWDAFWRGEILGRPCLHIIAPRDGVEPRERPGQLGGLRLGFRPAAEEFEEYAATRVFLAEAVPFFQPCFGPDQFAAFFGARLQDSADSPDTNWAAPFVADWNDLLPIRFDEQNPTWQAMLEFVRVATQVSDGKFLVGQLDYHGNMDFLSAIRGRESLALDLMDCPETIQRAMAQVRPYFGIFYDAIYQAGQMRPRGTIGWTPFYCRGKFATIQCDFLCMISPAMARRFVIPALEEEAAHLDHCTFHYDGPGALHHFEDICGIPKTDVIQWVQGAGRGEHIHWVELLKRFQSRGKGLQVNGSADEVKLLHRELRPERVLYVVNGVKTEREGHDLIQWFQRNT